MRLRTKLLAALALATAVTLHAAQKNDPAKVMFEAAKKKELVDGDLNGAIQQYKAIVTKYGNDHVMAADALIHMAECYQKLGDDESRKIYERILKEYGEQKQAVAMARARLGKGSMASDSGMSFRKIWQLTPGGDDAAGLPSPDGRYLPYVDWEDNGNLYVHDFSSGTNRRLTDTATDGLRPQTKVDQFALSADFSKDGKHLAYTWFRADKNRFELRLMEVRGDGIPASHLLFDNPEVSSIEPGDWSPDGKFIAVGIGRTDKTGQIGLISVADGGLRVLKSVDWRGPTTLAFSPDGNYLAYDIPVGDDTDQRDIFVLATDGSREIPAIVGPSQDTVVGWSGDGKRLLFASNRSGSEGLWSVPFIGGKVDGPPQLLRRDIEQFSRLGLIGGKLYGVVHTPNAGGSKSGDIYTGTVDFETGKIQSAPSLAVQTFVGNNTFPAWSLDGKYLAYASRRGSVGPRHFVIELRSLDTGETRELSPSPGLDLLYTLAWASDGRSLFAVGGDTKGRYGIFRIDAQTGRTSALVVKEDSEAIPVAVGISNDGTKLYYAKASGGPPRSTALFVRDLASGSEREMLHTPNPSAPQLSPDGRYVAMIGADPSKPRGLSIMPSGGGKPQELAPDIPPQVVDWSADSSAIFFLKAPGGLWRLPINGGEAQKVDLKSDGTNLTITGFRMHPDGRRIALQTPVPKNPGEIWMLENFLANK